MLFERGVVIEVAHQKSRGICFHLPKQLVGLELERLFRIVPPAGVAGIEREGLAFVMDHCADNLPRFRGMLVGALADEKAMFIDDRVARQDHQPFFVASVDEVGEIPYHRIACHAELLQLLKQDPCVIVVLDDMFWFIVDRLVDFLQGDDVILLFGNGLCQVADFLQLVFFVPSVAIQSQ